MRFPASTQLSGVMALTIAVVVGMSTGRLAQPRELEPGSISQDNAPAAGATPASMPDAITLGQPCNHPYVVAIPTATEDLLDRIQAVVGSAFITDSRFGPYVQAGASPRRRPAEQASRQLRRAGFDARVIYRPIACGS